MGYNTRIARHRDACVVVNEFRDRASVDETAGGTIDVGKRRRRRLGSVENLRSRGIMSR